MFRDNKREIFGFRKYKAYGLASAVIAAFFLMGGVASADEVTKPTTSDVAALTTASPTEASANAVASSEEVAASNSAVETPAAANNATETPVVANETSTATTANETNSNDSVVASGANTSEATANTAAVSSDKKITATLTVPEDRTVKAASGFDDIRV